MKVKISKLNQLVKKALRHYGYSESETKLIFEVLLYAQLRGNNQGIVKLIGKGIPKSPLAKAPKLEKETKLSVLVNAHQTHAMIAVNQAVDIATKKALEHGMGLVAVNNINTSSGALGYYTRKIARAGLVGMVMAGS